MAATIRQRLYFIINDVDVCEDVSESLVDEGVDEDRIFVFHDLEKEMVSLPKSSVWDRKFHIPMFVYGAILGAIACYLAGWTRMRADSALGHELVWMVTVAGAVVGALMFWFASASPHEKRLDHYQKSVASREYLLVADVNPKAHKRLVALVVARHAAKFLGSVATNKL